MKLDFPEIQILCMIKTGADNHCLVRAIEREIRHSMVLFSVDNMRINYAIAAL